MKRILIEKSCDETLLVLADDDRLIDLRRVTPNTGGVYLCEVTRYLPELGGAFVDMGLSREGFLPTASEKKRGDSVVAQLVLDKTDVKAYRLTENVSLFGRFLALMSETRANGVSKRVTDKKERERLLALLKKFDCGMLLARESAVGKSDAELRPEADRLKKTYDEIQSRAFYREPPCLLYERPLDIAPHIRAFIKLGAEEVVFSEDDSLNKAVQAIKSGLSVNVIAKGRSPVSMYAANDFALLTQKRVPLPCGGNIVIEPTEAMTVIDVNSGGASGFADKKGMIARVNVEAAAELVRQLRLRNIGGVVIVDFIDDGDSASYNGVQDAMREEAAPDTCEIKLFGFTALGNFELTRSRRAR